MSDKLTEREWQPIETAPRDGTLIDVWCVSPGDSDFEPEKAGIRLTDISWIEAEDAFPHTGWIRMCDDGNVDLVEEGSPAGSLCFLPPWIPTHWMPLPEAPPESKTRIDAMDAWAEDEAAGIDDADPS